MTVGVEIAFVAMELQRIVHGSKTNMRVGQTFKNNDLIDQPNPQNFIAEPQAENGLILGGLFEIFSLLESQKNRSDSTGGSLTFTDEV